MLLTSKHLETVTKKILIKKESFLKNCSILLFFLFLNKNHRKVNTSIWLPRFFASPWKKVSSRNLLFWSCFSLGFLHRSIRKIKMHCKASDENRKLNFNKVIYSYKLFLIFLFIRQVVRIFMFIVENYSF